MKLETRFEPNQEVYAKVNGGVVKGQISAIAIDASRQPKQFTFVYLLWVSDRRDNAGHHVWVYEKNIGTSFEEAYYDADNKLPWDLMEDAKWENVTVLIAKAHKSDKWCPVPEALK